MAQTIAEIQQEIINEKNAEPVLAALTSTSNVAKWRLWTYVFAVCAHNLQRLWDTFRVLIESILALLKPHTLKWYGKKSLDYQHGHQLVQDEDYYDNTGLTESQVEASKVVKYAAAVEVLKGVRLKVASLVNGDLAPLTSPQEAGFAAYIKRIKDAGVRVYITNLTADSLKLEMDIYYDPLILSATGERLDGTNNTPVQDAIDTYLKSDMIFNGMFLPLLLTDRLQEVEGVVIPVVKVAQAQYGLLPYQLITVEYNPDSGYLRIINPSDLVLNFIPHAPII